MWSLYWLTFQLILPTWKSPHPRIHFDDIRRTHIRTWSGQVSKITFVSPLPMSHVIEMLLIIFSAWERHTAPQSRAFFPSNLIGITFHTFPFSSSLTPSFPSFRRGRRTEIVRYHVITIVNFHQPTNQPTEDLLPVECRTKPGALPPKNGQPTGQIPSRVFYTYVLRGSGLLLVPQKSSSS